MEYAKYLDACPQLPISAPVGHPHLIDTANSPYDGAGIPDLVVTILFNHKPETLDRFLDMSHDFKFHPSHQLEKGSLDFCIIRKGTTVTCGYLTESVMRRVQLWDSQHVYRLGDGPTGKWTPVIWKAAGPGLVEITEKRILEIGGYSIVGPLTGRVWEEHETVEMVVEDSCDI